MARAAAARRGRRAGQPRRDRNADLAACPDRARTAPRPAGQGRGAPADRIVQGARAGDGGDHGQGSSGSSASRMPTNGNAGAALAAYGAAAGIETIVICPAETPEINVTETAAYGARVYVADGQIDECGALVGKGAAAGPVVRLLDAEGALSPRRQEGDGVRARRAARLAAARRDLLSDRRRHRPDRHVEGVRRNGGGRADRARAAAHVSRSRPRAARRSSGRSRRATNSPSAGRMRRRSRPASACPRRSAIS